MTQNTCKHKLKISDLKTIYLTFRIMKISFFMSTSDFRIWPHLFIADSGDESGLFPVAALFTGALLTIGLAVLLIVFIALRKNREQVQTHDNGIKEKHIGKWIFFYFALMKNFLDN